ncbi:hypothetical protein WICPIJ_008217 [Wickerhamomyces pijperi]|uniref:Ribose-phosphate pyrophosphokinase N-terminal domain-containing protein n=1 Tax=Wickerhamomyces pijperi TaxID=599730 RepID=A0A9P8PXZ7_WICPI|nr:hypothetical protein WICPIJ_008217 [Wickerhamomyces pijperi]
MVHDIVVFSGSSHPGLVSKIVSNLSLEEGRVKLGKFSNGETSISIGESVREKDVYVIQSSCGNINDNFMELLIMLSACKTASAKRVTAVLPLFPYSRQPDLPYSKKGINRGKQSDTPAVEKPNPLEEENNNNTLTTSKTGYKTWIAQSGTLIAELLTKSGADHIITMDLHDAQFQGFFDISVDNLYSKPILQHYIQTKIPDYQNCVIVSPDAGGAKRATAIADNLLVPFALIHKEKRFFNPKHASNSNLDLSSPQNSASSSGSSGSQDGKSYATTMIVGDVEGKDCIIVDDLVDTSYTITRAAKLLKRQNCGKIYVLITHGIFSGDALERIQQSAIDKIVVTNSVPQEKHQEVLGDKLVVLDVSRILGEAIRRIHNGESVSILFDHGW